MNNSSKFDVFDLILIVKKRFKLLFFVFICVSVISVVVSLLLPKWYKASVTLMPPKKSMSGGLSSISSLVGALPSAGFEMFRGSEEAMRFLAILNSRTVMDQTIKRYNLMEVYQAENIEDARRALFGNLTTELDNEGTITISVIDKSPQLAADIANAFVFYLDSLDRVLNIYEARNNREFIEKRLEENKLDLKQAEEAFKNFQQKSGTVEITEQTKSEIEMLATLQALIVSDEIELEVKKLSYEENHAEIILLRNKLEEMYKKRREMVNGLDSVNQDTSNLFIPIKKLPNLALQYGRLFREVEIQNKIFAILTEQYEMAKIEEARDVPTVQVLDEAVPPIRKAKPKRAILVLVSTFLTMFLLVIFLITIDRMRALSTTDPTKYEKAADIFKSLKKG